MKKTIGLTVLALFFSVPLCLAQMPKQLGGFVLGEDIAAHEDRIQKDTMLNIRYQEYLSEVEMKRIDGFKSGLITFGTCDDPGKILRIKLKYANSSKKFYSALLKQFKKKFGEPNEWRGDPFHVVIAWKWNFSDKDGNQVSLTLQHNTMDQEEKMGNSVKMTLTSQITREHECYDRKHPEQHQARKKKGKINWDLFVPK